MGGLFHYSFKMGRRPKQARRDPFGAWLHYLRKQAGLSQEEVQQKLLDMLDHDVGHATISHWERKGNLAGRDTIPALAEIFGVSIEYLLRIRRTKDNRYEKIVPTKDEEERLQKIGERKDWSWAPGQKMPKGYDAQDPFQKAKNFDGVIEPDQTDPPDKPVKPKKSPPEEKP